MFKWRKLGVVFDPTQTENRTWLKQFAQAPCVLVQKTSVRVFFSCRPSPDENQQYVSYAAYVDLSRSNLFEILRVSESPVLQLGEPGEFDEFGTYPISVIQRAGECVAYYGGWTRCESVPFNVSIGMAKSFDGGNTFKKVGRGPVLSFSEDEPFILSSPKIRWFNERWYLYYIAGRKWILANGKPEPVYRIRMATSDNGVDWIKLNEDLIEAKLGENEAQASPDVFHYENKYHMFFCYREGTDFRSNKSRSYRIGYAHSEDLIKWTRDDCRAGIDVSTKGWDSEMVAYPHVFEVDGHVYMFYLGNQVGKHGFGVAQLDQDGYGDHIL